ncbi:MAG: MmgE/PrpD family protein [Alphaproteobacteria bacterium]|nr:MmgE/PrpD family protein [Alphaproteobacteria bacterium]
MPQTIEFIHDICFDELPSHVVHEAVRCLADTLGVAAGGSQTSLSRIIREHAAGQFGGDGARLWWDGRQVSAAGAALANGMTIDALDAHDGHKLTKGHVGCGVIPALIGLMQAEGKTGAKELLTGVVVGYEIGTRAGIALHATASDYHTSGAWIALAAAALGARQLGLNHDQTREAIGIGEYHGPRSQMMRCIDSPTMVKDGSGGGAMAGVSAAYLARDGFTGAPAITMQDEALAHIWDDLGRNWRICEQYIKIYPVCRWAQPAVEAVLGLAGKHVFEADEIESVEIETFHEAKRLHNVPQTTEQAQYSLPFSVAAALVRGTIGVAEVTRDGLKDRQIMGLTKKVSITECDRFNQEFPARRFARARVQLRDGRILTSPATEAKGDPENKLGDEVVWSKFYGLTSPVLGDEGARDLARAIGALPEGGSTAHVFDLVCQRRGNA